MSDALSKSRYCQGVQCPKILWMNQHKPEEFDPSVMNQSVLDTGSRVGDLAMGLFGEYTEVPYGNLSEMIAVTEKLIRKKTRVICEASFSYEGLFCSVDILINQGRKKVEIYEVKSSTHLRDIYIDDTAYQSYVLEQLGYHVTKVCLVHLNSTYERIGELKLNELFAIEDLTPFVKKKYSEIEANIEEFRSVMRKRKEPRYEVGKQCTTPYECGYFNYCTGHLPHPNVFDLKGVQPLTKMKYYHQGLITFDDLYESADLKNTALLQVSHEVRQLEDHIDKESIRAFLKELKYPLYFLDFEAFQPAVPLYDHSFPYEQIPFQYSLHYMKRKNGKLYHKEFLADPDQDPRRELAESLCKDIPVNVCVLAYNMSYEKGRIRRLAGLYPDLRDHLMKIHDNIRDLMTPFQKRWYYTKGMQGSYSVKYVLPALYPNDPQLDYHRLEGVHNGFEASETFSAMREMDEETRNAKREYLLRYCELDTFAMVKILEKLQQSV